MANEVEITITARDLSGPAFDSATAHMLALRAASRGLKQELGGLAIPSLDGSKMQTSLVMLKSKLQSLRIADIADINVQPGLIMTQLNLLKRLIQQAGISDILDINVNQGKLTQALSNLANITETIPVKFDVAHMPKLPELGLTIPVRYSVLGSPGLAQGGEAIPVKFKPDITALNAELALLSHTVEKIPIKFELGNLPKFAAAGPTEHINVTGGGISQAVLASWAALGADTYKVNAGLGDLRPLINAVSGAWATAGARAQMFGDTMASHVNTGLIASSIILSRVRGSVMGAASSLLGLATAAAAAVGGGGGGGGITGMGGAWAGFGGRLAFTLPILGLTIRSVAAWHIVLDGAIEALIAVGLAASAAAVGVASMMPTLQGIRDHMNAVNAVGSSLNSSVLPKLDRQFDALGKSMAPKTVEAFGGALALAGNKASVLGNIAGKVVTLFDDWIAKMDIWASGQGIGKALTAGIGYLSQFGSIIGTLGQALGNLLTKDPGIARFLLDIIGGLVGLLKAFTMLPGPVVQTVLALHGLYIWASVIAPALGLAVAKLGQMGLALIGLAANPLFWVAAAAIAVGYLATQFGAASKSAKTFISSIDTGISSGTATQAILGIAGDIGQLTAKINSAGSAQGIAKIKMGWNSLGNTATSFDADLQHSGHAWETFWNSLFSKGNGMNSLLHSVDTFGSAIKSVFVSGGGASIVAADNIKAFDAEINKLIAQQGTLFLVAGKLTGQNLSLAQAFALEDLAGVKASDSFDLAYQKVQNLIKGYAALGVQGGILSNSVNAVTFATEMQNSKILTVTQAWDGFFKIIANGYGGLYQFETAMATMTGKSLPGLSAATTTAGNNFLAAAQAAQTEATNLMTLSAAGGQSSKGTDMVTSSVKDMISTMLPAAKHSADFTNILYALAQQGGYQGADSFKALSGWVKTASGSIAAAKDPTKQLQDNVSALDKAAGNLTTDTKRLSLALGTDLTQAEASAITLARGGIAPFNNFALAVAHTGATSKTTRDTAIKLGDEFLQLANNNVPAAKREFESFAIGGLHLTQQHADQLWQDILNHGLPALADAGNAATNLKNNHLAPLGVGVDTVAGKVRNLSAYLLAVPRNISSQVTVHGSGTGGINILPTPSGLPSGNARFTTLAGGGLITKGTHGTADDVLARLSKGETVVSAAHSKELASAFAAVGVPGYAYGGIVGSKLPRIPGYIGGIVAEDAGDIMASFARAMIAKDQAAMNAKAKASAGSIGNYHPGAGVQQWRGVTQQALGLAGANVAQLTDAVLYQMQTESGGNPTAVNRTDSNWLAGHPSVGLMQVIRGTFDSYAGRFINTGPFQYGVSENPLANIYSAIKYAQAAYGPGLRTAYGGIGTGHGYDQGGWLQPGLTMAYNGTGKPEFVSPPGAGLGAPVTLHVSGGSSEFEQFMVKMIRKYVKVRHGGNSQKAFGSAGVVGGSSNWRTG